MRGIKPFKLGMITRPFSWGAQHHLGISVLGYFPFDPPHHLLVDVEMWPQVGELLGPNLTLDVGIPKSRSELIVVGTAHQPGGRPATTCPVRVRVGSLSKSLYVIGDRVWRRGVPSEPRPFTQMDLSWSNAFGGEGYDKNPLGKGVKPVKDKDGVETHPLPNLELPGRLLTSPKDRPEPAGFGPIDFTWPQRASMMGTYDARWLETRYPGFAEDLDWRIWNVAPSDQQQEAPFGFDDGVLIENMHPTRPRIETSLPNVQGRAFVTRVGAPDELIEVELRLTTVWLLPAIERGVVIFQGAVPVREDDAADIDVVMVAAERPREPRGLEHYRAVLAKRLDRERLEEQLNDADLVPPELAGLGDEVDHQMALTSIQGLRAKRQRVAAEEQIAQTRAHLVELGLDPDEHGPTALPPDEPLPPLGEIAEYVRTKRAQAEQQMEDAKARQEASVAIAAKFYEEAGLDFDVVRDEMATSHRGPPDYSADEERAKMRRWADEMAAMGQRSDELEHYASDPEHYARWQAMEARLAETYRTFGHFQEPALRRTDAAALEERERVEEEVRRGESFARRDLTGLDLSGLDLSGARFDGAFLESVNLEDANLSGASFENAVLAHAVLTRANLHGTSFRGANLGRATLDFASSGGRIDLTGAQLWGASLRGTDLSGALLAGATMLEVVLDGADLSNVEGTQLVFHKTPLENVRFTGAKLTSTAFIELEARDIDFSGATLDESGFVRCVLDGSKFVNAQMLNARFALETSAVGCDFKGACLDRANLRGVALTGADFSGARLNGADLSEADMKGARFYRIVAHESLWMKAKLNDAFLVSADLMSAILQKADLRGADLRGANLYGADFALVRGDARTNVTDAIQLKLRARPLWIEPPEEP